MEGTRNERVALLITAYVIGFTTAFIAYGLTNDGSNTIATSNPIETTTQSAAVAASSQQAVSNYPQLRTDEIGLHLELTANDSVLLSYQAAANTQASAGAYHKIAGAAISPNQEYVYFCEQQNIESETCVPYVYSIAEDLVYPVQDINNPENYTVENHRIGWSDTNELVAE